MSEAVRLTAEIAAAAPAVRERINALIDRAAAARANAA